MDAMDRDPSGRRILQSAHAQDRQQMLEPFRAAERTMRQAAMEACADAERAKQVIADEHKSDAGPTEQPGDEGKQRQKMNRHYADRIGPVDMETLRGSRPRQGFGPPRTRLKGNLGEGSVHRLDCVGPRFGRFRRRAGRERQYSGRRRIFHPMLSFARFRWQDNAVQPARVTRRRFRADHQFVIRRKCSVAVPVRSTSSPSRCQPVICESCASRSASRLIWSGVHCDGNAVFGVRLIVS